MHNVSMLLSGLLVLASSVSFSQTWETPLQAGGNYLTSFMTDIQMMDANNGWAVGHSGLILTTSDGGSTWTTQTSGTTSALNRISIKPPTGCIVGSQGALLIRPMTFRQPCR